MPSGVRHDSPQKPAPPPVVVGVDGSEESKDALRWAVDYAELAGARVRAVIAWRWPLAPAVALPFADVLDPEAEALNTLNTAIAEALGDRPSASVRAEACYGAAVPVLVEQSARASLLVVGSRGRGEFAGLLLGSTSEHCLRHAPCPVAVIRAGKHPRD